MDATTNQQHQHQDGSPMQQQPAPPSKKRKRQAVKSFEQRMHDLREYKEKHGHVNVKKSEDESLYYFCYNMRHALKNPEKSRMVLTDGRIASLDAVGFDWIVQKHATKKSFEQRIEDLRAYKEKHGHVNVKKSEDKSLYDFYNHMRRARKNPEKLSSMNLTDDRIASLDALGFEWNLNSDTKSFAQRIADLKAYKEKHGHIKVKMSDDKSLYTFCRDIRKARNNPGKYDRALTDNRIASLDALGFDWTVKEQAAKKSFDQRIEDLQVYKERHGSTNVKKSDDKSLYEFCHHMRQARNNPEKSKTLINDDRIASLDALGFEWSPDSIS